MAKPPSWLLRRRTGGIVLLLLSFGLSLLLALVQDAAKPPSRATDMVIVILIAVSQVAAGWAFSGDGKADPGLAERSVARLVWLAQRAGQAGARAQTSYESSSSTTVMHAEMGIVSTEFSWLEDGVLQAIDDWRVFHPQAVQRAEGTDRA